MGGNRFVLSHGPLTVDLDRRGAVICGFRWRDADGVTHHLMRDGSRHDGDPLTASCFPLVPYCNRVRGNHFQVAGRDYRLLPNQPWDRHSLHGDGWLSVWQVLAQRDASLRFGLRRTADPQSPYDYEAEIAYELTTHPQPKLTVALSVRNRSAESMPFGLGLHPYFPLTPQTTLRADATGFFPEEAEFLPGAMTAIPADLNFSAAIPLPRRWINNGFKGWNGKADIIWPEHALGLQIEADAGFQDYFVFMPNRIFEPNFADDHFCFEPMTHQADAHHASDLGGLRLLAPGAAMNDRVSFMPKRSIA